jgi:hypothetical protein
MQGKREWSSGDAQGKHALMHFEREERRFAVLLGLRGELCSTDCIDFQLPHRLIEQHEEESWEIKTMLALTTAYLAVILNRHNGHPKNEDRILAEKPWNGRSESHHRC